MDVLPICPAQAGYTASFNDGVLQITLDGGSPRSRVSYSGGVCPVEVTWVVNGDDYSLLQGFYRRQARRGYSGFLADLILDDSVMQRYTATFRAGSLRLAGKQGGVFTVTASLLVDPLAKYADSETDPYEYIIDLLPYYGNVEAIRQVMNRLEKLVNEDWPNA